MTISSQSTRKAFRARAAKRVKTGLVHSFFTVNRPFNVERAECGAEVSVKSEWVVTDDPITCPLCLGAKAYREGQEEDMANIEKAEKRWPADIR